MARTTPPRVVRVQRPARPVRRELDLVPDLALELFAALDAPSRRAPAPAGDEQGRPEPPAPAL